MALIKSKRSVGSVSGGDSDTFTAVISGVIENTSASENVHVKDSKSGFAKRLEPGDKLKLPYLGGKIHRDFFIDATNGSAEWWLDLG